MPVTPNGLHLTVPASGPVFSALTQKHTFITEGREWRLSNALGTHHLCHNLIRQCSSPHHHNSPSAVTAHVVHVVHDTARAGCHQTTTFVSPHQIHISRPPPAACGAPQAWRPWRALSIMAKLCWSFEKQSHHSWALCGGHQCSGSAASTSCMKAICAPGAVAPFT